MKKYAIIVAGGSGARMNTAIPKQFLLLQDKPVLFHTLTAFLTAFADVKIILVLPEAYLETGKLIAAAVAEPYRIQTVAGGETRFQSVKNGLENVEKDSVVFVHDAVRCLVSPALIRRCYDATIEKGNAVPATTAIDSVRIENDNGSTTIDRARVKMIQTPQTFFANDIIDAFKLDYDVAFTDEAAVLERAGIKINLIEGEKTNIKITLPVDLLIAEKLLEYKATVQ